MIFKCVLNLNQYIFPKYMSSNERDIYLEIGGKSDKQNLYCNHRPFTFYCNSVRIRRTEHSHRRS